MKVDSAEIPCYAILVGKQKKWGPKQKFNTRMYLASHVRLLSELAYKKLPNLQTSALDSINMEKSARSVARILSETIFSMKILSTNSVDYKAMKSCIRLQNVLKNNAELFAALSRDGRSCCVARYIVALKILLNYFLLRWSELCITRMLKIISRY